MDFEEVIRDRFAVRKFDNKQIETEKLNKILEAGRLAPTAKNLQPIKIYAVRSEDGIKKIDMATPCRYGAPTVLIVCGDTSIAFSKGEHSTCEIDATITATQMMLEATNVGIGNIWIELFDRKILKSEFSLPENLVPVCLIPIGYIAENCPENPNHTKRKPLSEIAEII